jgi:hypothetical protein
MLFLSEAPKLLSSFSTKFLAGCWWLISIILDTQEAEIRRIGVRRQLGQIVHETLS